SSKRRHTRLQGDWSSDVCSSDLHRQRPTRRTYGDPEPTHRKFGALAFVYGTVATSAIAMIIAVPLGVGTAAFLSEIAPSWLRRKIGRASCRERGWGGVVCGGLCG